MANRFQRLDNQSPVQNQLETTDLNVGRSAFDFSTIHSGNTIFGALTPVDCFDVVPNEDISISMANYLEVRNPTTRPLLNGARVYYHAYYNRLVDLWEGAKNFLDTGRSGNISLPRPNLIYEVSFRDEGDLVYANACTPLSLLNFLGLPVEKVQDKSPASRLRSFQTAVTKTGKPFTVISVGNHPGFFPADCAFAYQRNWRDFYANKNLLQNNKFWFPDNEDHFILSYSCVNACALNYEHEDFNGNEGDIFNSLTGFDAADYPSEIETTPEPNNPVTVTPPGGWSGYYAPNLSGLKFRQFRGDRFTAALPFPDLIRGDIPVLSDFGKVGDYSSLQYLTDDGDKGTVDYDIATTNGYGDVHPAEGDGENRFLTVVNPSSDTGTIKFRLNSVITQNDIRALETFTVFKERMARTSGDYNDMIEAQYGVSPHVHTREGTYIGGFYQDFGFSSVTQTSASNENSPLGTKAGLAASNGSGTICSNFHVPDFGWIQIYQSIVYDVMYTQGEPRQFMKKTQLDMYFPIFNNLAPQAIKNGELYITGDSAVDDDVFAFEDRYAEYKSRGNRVSGFMSLPHDVAEYDASRIMTRHFDDTPALNSQFVTMVPENVDMQVFSVYDEPPFDFSCGISVRRVFPGPYTAVPGSMSSKLHA